MRYTFFQVVLIMDVAQCVFEAWIKCEYTIRSQIQRNDTMLLVIVIHNEHVLSSHHTGHYNSSPCSHRNFKAGD